METNPNVPIVEVSMVAPKKRGGRKPKDAVTPAPIADTSAPVEPEPEQPHVPYFAPEPEQQPPAPIEDMPAPVVEAPKQEWTMNEPAPKRKMLMVVDINQKGIKDALGDLIDPNDNTFKSIKVEAEGNVDIAKIAGRLAQDIFSWYTAAKKTQLVRKYGFNVDISMIDTTEGSDNKVTFTSVSKLRLSNPIDIAFAIAGAVLAQTECNNDESLLTGNFAISEEGKLFMEKLNLNKTNIALPTFVINSLVDQKRRSIKTNVAEAKRQLN